MRWIICLVAPDTPRLERLFQAAFSKPDVSEECDGSHRAGVIDYASFDYCGTGPGCPWLSLHPGCARAESKCKQDAQCRRLVWQSKANAQGRANPRPLGSGESRPELHLPHPPSPNPFSTSLAWGVCIQIHAPKEERSEKITMACSVRHANARMDGLWP